MARQEADTRTIGLALCVTPHGRLHIEQSDEIVRGDMVLLERYLKDLRDIQSSWAVSTCLGRKTIRVAGSIYAWLEVNA
jgi:hypothetical protein